MAEIRQEIKDMREDFSDIKILVKDAIDKKADKEEVKELKDDITYWFRWAVAGVIGLLITIIFMLIKLLTEHRAIQ